MSLKHGWLIALVIVALLVGACGPPMVPSTPGEPVAGGGSLTATPVGKTPTTASTEKTPTVVAAADPTPTSGSPAATPTTAAEERSQGGESEDWRVLGRPDAPVTIVEYSDFQ